MDKKEREQLEKQCQDLEESPRTVSTKEATKILTKAGFTIKPGRNHGDKAVLGSLTITIPRNRRELGVHYVREIIGFVRSVLDEADEERGER